MGRIVLLSALMLAATAPRASAQATTTQPPATAASAAAAQAPAAVPATRKFTSDAGIMFSVIKPEKTADFDAIMARVKEALNKSSDPKRKEMAQAWRVFKGIEAGPGGNVVYIWWFDPPVKDQDYSVSAILADAFPNEIQDLWAKYTACFVNGQTMLNLTQTVNMAANAIK